EVPFADSGLQLIDQGIIHRRGSPPRNEACVFADRPRATEKSGGLSVAALRGRQSRQSLNGIGDKTLRAHRPFVNERLMEQVLRTRQVAFGFRGRGTSKERWREEDPIPGTFDDDGELARPLFGGNNVSITAVNLAEAMQNDRHRGVPEAQR